eukprot:gene2513-801_t
MRARALAGPMLLDILAVAGNSTVLDVVGVNDSLQWRGPRAARAPPPDGAEGA